MRGIASIFVLALLAAPGAVHAATTVYGAGSGQACFEAARDGRTDSLAIAECDRALSNDQLGLHDFAATLVNRGVLHLRRREAASAILDFDRALGVSSRLGEAHVNRGAAMILLGDFRGAIAEIDRGLALGPEDPQEAWFNRAIAWEKLGDLNNAYKDYKKAQELAPAWALPTQELARFTVTSARP